VSEYRVVIGMESITVVETSPRPLATITVVHESPRIALEAAVAAANEVERVVRAHASKT
jgi:hypothetical protein